jgi:hypothetical protein
MSRIMKIALGSGFASMGLLALAFTLTGCSGSAPVPIDEVKINKLSPGEYLDSLDDQAKAKGKGKARSKR